MGSEPKVVFLNPLCPHAVRWQSEAIPRSVQSGEPAPHKQQNHAKVDLLPTYLWVGLSPSDLSDLMGCRLAPELNTEDMATTSMEDPLYCCFAVAFEVWISKTACVRGIISRRAGYKSSCLRLSPHRCDFYRTEEVVACSLDAQVRMLSARALSIDSAEAAVQAERLC